MANAVFESADVMGQLFGERERLTHQTGHALPQRVLEALDVLGLPRWLRDRFLALRRDHPCIGIVLIRAARLGLSRTLWCARQEHRSRSGSLP